uniref:Ribosomal protein S11 n=1 Tax=Oryza nivara TaxID=4536 RepID=A0A0E0FPG6_ORYNI
MRAHLQTLAPALRRAASASATGPASASAAGPASLAGAAPLSTAATAAFPPPQSKTASRLGLFSMPGGDTRQPSYGDRLMESQQLPQDYRANVPRSGDTMSRIAGGENPSYFGTPSHIFDEHKQSLVKGKRDFVHVLLKRNKTFVTVTDVRGNRKTGASAGCLEDKKGRSRLSKYAIEATAEHVGRAARKMGLKSMVMKVKGTVFFNKKKKVILSFREGFRGERVREQSPVVFIHDVTQLPHNGCQLPKQRLV